MSATEKEVQVDVMELKIVEKKLPVIDINFEAVKEYLGLQLKEHEGAVVTTQNLDSMKGIQKELGTMRKDIETYRKDIKAEMLLPITEFETKCKELKGMVESVEQPIKDGIEGFAEAEREKKRSFARKEIARYVSEFNLDEKYASKIQVLDSYVTVKISLKKITESVEGQALDAKGMQDKEKNNLEMLKTQIEQLNTRFNLLTPLVYEEYSKQIDGDNIMVVSQKAMNDAMTRSEVEKAAADAIAKAEAEKPVEDVPEETPEVEQPAPPTHVTADGNETYTLAIKNDPDRAVALANFINELGMEVSTNFTGSREDMFKLKDFLDGNMFEYKKI